MSARDESRDRLTEAGIVRPGWPDEGRKALEAALVAYWDEYPTFTTNGERMRAAIKAYLANLPGWRMVPFSPSFDMRAVIEAALDEAYNGTKDETVEGAAVKIYQAMLDMRPPPPGLEDSSE